MYDQAIILRQLMQNNTRRQMMVPSWGVLGVKGGVGTTSVAIALALESARLGFRTLLIDMTSTEDVVRVLRQYPSCGWMQALSVPKFWNTAIFSVSPSLEILSGRGRMARYPDANDSVHSYVVKTAMAEELSATATMVKKSHSKESDNHDRWTSSDRWTLSEDGNHISPKESEQPYSEPYKSGDSQMQSRLLTELDALSVASHVTSADMDTIFHVPSDAQTFSEIERAPTTEMRMSRFRWDRIVLDLGCRREGKVSVMEQAVTRLIPVTTTHPGSLESCGEIVARYQRSGLANRVDILFNQTSASDFAIEQNRLVQWCQTCAGVVPRIVGTLPTDPQWEADLLFDECTSNVNGTFENPSDGTVFQANRSSKRPSRPWRFLRRRSTMATAIESVVPRLLVPPPDTSGLDLSEEPPREVVGGTFSQDEEKNAIPDVFRKVA